MGAQKKFHAKSYFSADNGESIRKMALAGGGIARLSAFMVRADIQQGRLVPLLENKNPGDLQTIFLLHASNIPTRVKTVINFIFAKLGGTCFK